MSAFPPGMIGVDKVSIVLQAPNTSLDPRMPVWRIITEPVFLHKSLGRDGCRKMAADLLEKVGLRAEHLDRDPREFFGGQRQRIAIARALSSQPQIIILDEPTSALDVSVQAQVVNLLLELQADKGLAYVFISHNVSVIRHFCDDVSRLGPVGRNRAAIKPHFAHGLLFPEPLPAGGGRLRCAANPAGRGQAASCAPPHPFDLSLIADAK